MSMKVCEIRKKKEQLIAKKCNKARNMKPKKPIFWNQFTITSKHCIDHNLFITHRMIQDIQNLFFDKYKTLNPIEISDKINIPLTMTPLREELKHLSACVKNIMQKDWLLDVSHILKNYHTPVSGKESDNLKTVFCSHKLFKCIISLLSIHMRIIILSTLQYVRIFFKKYTVNCKQGENQSLKYSVPFVIVEIKFNKQLKTLEIHPNMNAVHDEIKHFLHNIISITNKISLLDFIVVQNKMVHNLFPVSSDDVEVQQIITDILNSIKTNITNPQECLKPYEIFIPILDGSLRNHLKNRLSSQSDLKLDEFHKEIEKYHHFMNLLSKNVDQIQLNFLQINCCHINAEIQSTLKLLHDELCIHFLNKLRDNNLQICKIFDDVANKISETPETTRQVVELCSYLTECKDTTMYHLKSKLSRSAELLLFVVKYFPLGDDDIALNTRTFTWPKEMERILELGITRLNIRKEMLESTLKVQRSNYAAKLEEVKLQINELKKKDLPLLTESEAKFFVGATSSLAQSMELLTSEASAINEEESLLDMELTTFLALANMNSLVKSLHTLWHATHRFLVEYDKWFYQPIHSLDVDEISGHVKVMEGVLQSLTKDVTSISAVRRAVEILKNKIENFKKYIPLLEIVCNRRFRDRHWGEVGGIIGHELDSRVLSLSQVISLELDKYVDKLVDISDNATKEFELEENLNKMYNEWDDKYFQLQLYRETGVMILHQEDEIQMLLDDHILKVQTLRSQPNVEIFITEVLAWEEKLILVQDIIDQWLTCQTTWINLQPIFNSDDIAWQMPMEAEEFKKVDSIWRTLIEKIKCNLRVLDITNIENIIDKFKSCNAMLNEINKSLDDYLDRKRSLFGRFYFLTNNELSMLISISKNLPKIQTQLYKCFEGIQSLQVTKDEEIMGIVTIQDEHIPFSGRIYFSEMKGFIEKWLIQVEDNMKSSIRDICQDTISSYVSYNFKNWILSWPGQSVTCCYQIYWTSHISESLRNKTVEQLKVKQHEELECLLALTREQLEIQNFTKVVTLVTLNLHFGDILEMLVENEINDPTEFHWLSQMRFYWLNGNVTISNVTTSINYGFECIGDNSRLIITPLTDRCFMLIMSAMKLNLYAALEGPTGTGKTETLKDFSKAAAKHFILLYCSPYIQYKLISNMFKGMAQCGSWLCLDNLSETRIEVLSVLAQQMLTIQIATKGRAEKINFDGADIKIPSNLKYLFRTIALIQPDYIMIIEVTLAAYGMKGAKSLSNKLLDVLQLLSHQLIRTKYVLNAFDVSSILDQVKRYVLLHGTMSEDEILLLALNDVLLTKISQDDVRMFKSICNTTFFNSNIRSEGNLDLKNHIQDSLKANYSGLANNEWYLGKLIQLHETTNRKRGIILVGEHMTGKTQAIKTLAEMFDVLHDKNIISSEQKILYSIMNPTIVTLEELYGKYDTNTQEWVDGLFTKVCREYVSQDSGERKWIILDGVADRLWMEYLNPIFDDSKKLYLSSGEVMKIPNSMSVILEVANLTDASPATITRCGVIYMDSNKIGWRDNYISFKDVVLNKLPVEQADVVFHMIEWLTEPMLQFLHSQCKSFIALNDSHRFVMFIEIFKYLIIPESNINVLWLQCTLLFSLLWGLCSTIDNDSKSLFDVFFRNLLAGKVSRFPKPKTFNLSKSQLFPEKATVFEWVYDKVNNGSWLRWTDVIPKKLEFLTQQNERLIVQTTEACVMNFFLSMNVVKQKVPTIFVGPSGVGKTSISLNFIQNLSLEKYIYNYMTFNVSLNPKHIQKLMIDNLDRRRKEVYGPTMGKYCVMFIDDLNSNIKIQKKMKLIELLRQWIEHGYLIDYDNLSFSYLIDIVLVANMCPTTDKDIQRFIHHANVIGIDHFDKITLRNIFTTILDSNLAKLNAMNLGSLSKNIVTATANIFLEIDRIFVANPKSQHCVFHLNDILRVFKGLAFVSISSDSENNNEKITKVWIHEIYRNLCDRLTTKEHRDTFFDIFKKNGMSCFLQFEEILNDITKITTSTSTDISEYMFSSIFSANRQVKVYEEVTNVNDFGKKVENLFLKYKAEFNYQLDFVFFKSALQHLCRILRILLFENEHIMLIGLLGTGKNSNVKLASIISKYTLNEMPLEILNPKEWKLYLKNMFLKIGTTDCNLLFKINDEDIPDESYLHDIHTLLCTGNILDIFASEEKAEIMKKITDHFEEETNHAHMNSTQTLDTFCQRIRTNLHFIFITSLNTQTTKSSIFSSLTKYCVIDWYQTWPTESLQDVATYNFKKIGLSDNLIDKFKRISEYIHKDMYDSTSDNHQHMFIKTHVAPYSFLHFIKCFIDLYHEKLNTIMHQKKQYDIGLAKLNQVANQVGLMQSELRELQPKLLVKSQLSDKLMIKIEQNTINVEARKEVVAADEALANEAAAAAQAIKDDCESDLAEASPALETALTALDTLKHSDITIIKSMKNPPAGVRLVMEAVCVLKGVKPEKVQDPVTGQIIDDYWLASTKILGDIKFLESLKTFDKDNIPPVNMKRIRENYMNDRSFQPDIIRKTSMACEGLCKWIRAMEVYDRVIKVVAPKKKMLLAAEAELAVQMETLNAKRALLQDVTDKLQQLNDEFAECLREKRDLENQIDLCIQKLERAEKLLSGLNNERIRWNDITVKLDNKCTNMAGDILLASAFIVYLANVDNNQRKFILNKWLLFCESVDIPYTKEFKFHEVFVEAEDVKSWDINGLPNDDYLIDNAVIVKETGRFPVIVDPHWQANKWVKNIERDNKICIVNCNDNDYLNRVEQSMETGTPVLIENISMIDNDLKLLLRKDTFKLGNELYIKSISGNVKYSNNFRLYVTTLKQDFSGLSEIAVYVTLVNFSITTKGLKNSLLKLIMAEKSQTLNSTKEQLIFESINNNRSLREIECNILHILSSTEGNILDDETTLKTLSSSKATAEGIRAKQLSIKNAIEDIQKSKQNYLPIAEHATCLLFAISELSFIEHMYHFSIQWFFHIFINTIRKTSVPLDGNEDLSRMKHDLNLVYYQTVCRSLFHKDRIVFSFILTLFLLKQIEDVDITVARFFLDNNFAKSADVRSPVNWISNDNWSLVMGASKLSGFKDWNVSIVENISEWKRFYYSKDPLSFQLPEPFQNERNSLKTLVIIRCLRIEKLIDAVKSYVSSKIGPYLVETSSFDMTDIYNDSINTSPILLICRPETDPVNYIKMIAKKQGLQRKQLLLLSFDQDRKVSVINMIKKSIKTGEWVIIQNCHLFEKSINYLDWLVEHLITAKDTHSSFRLWLTTCPFKTFPLTLLSKCLKVVVDDKSNIRNNSLVDFVSQSESDAPFSNNDENILWRKLISSTYYFHLIVKERSYYSSYGWNQNYAFDDTILKINLAYLKILISYYDHLPLNVCTFYIGECVYGSKISDITDRRLLNTMLHIYLESIITNNRNVYAEKLYPLLNKAEDRESLNLGNMFHLTHLNDNAYIIKQNDEATLFLNTLSLTENTVPRADDDASEDRNSLTKNMISKITKIIPSSFDVESIGTNEESNLEIFLACELAKFNDLVNTIKSTLEQVMEVCEGKRNEDVESTIMYEDIQSARLPEIWRRKSYLTIKPLASYIDDLISRAEFYQRWIDERTAKVIWISGLFSASSFVIAQLMDYSKKHRVPFETSTATYEITTFENAVENAAPFGVYVSGLYLDGARWNRVKRSLDECTPKVTLNSVPLILLKPGTVKPVSANDIFRCPVYATLARKNPVVLNVHLNDEDSYIRFPSERPELHWILRGTACICQSD